MLSRSCLAREKGKWKSSFDIIRTGESPLDGQVCAEKKKAIGFEAEDEDFQETEAASYFFTWPNAGYEER